MKELVEILTKKELTISCAESLTGGLFAATLCEIPGVSKVFKGGVVTYWNEMKNKVINVPNKVIKEYGVVSSECASFMAKGVKELYETDISISFTGNAGPDVMEGKPVGLVYIGLCYKDTTFTFEYYFEGSRNEIRKKCINEGLKRILKIF